MKKLLLLATFLTAAFSMSELGAQIIAEFDRQNAAGCVSSNITYYTVANLSATELCRGTGLNMGTGGDYNSNSFDTANGSAADAESDGDYLSFTITPDAGFEVVVTQLNIRLDRSSTGPPNYEIRAIVGGTPTVVGAGTISDPGSEHYLPLSTPVSATSIVAFQVLAWGASSSAGTMDVEGSTFGGTRILNDPGIQILGQVNVILPVELGSFTASAADERSVLLEWTTESEDKNAFFAIEHSRNGIDFFELDQVPGAGTSYIAQLYSYLHDNPVKGSNYYRLRQTDFDGIFSYSPVKAVEIQRPFRLSVHPTLARYSIEVSIADEFDHHGGTIELLDLNGRQLIMGSFNGDNRQQINITDLPEGHYIIRVSSERNSQIARFVKSH